MPDSEQYSIRLCSEVLDFVGITRHMKQLELSVTLADDAYVHLLNKQYRHKDKPTNVLSFANIAITPPSFDQIEHYNGYALLGDIILSLETLEKEALEQGKTLKAHFSHLLIHGTLHLLGYDHETEEEAHIMEALEIALLATHSIASPYESSHA